METCRLNFPHKYTSLLVGMEEGYKRDDVIARRRKKASPLPPSKGKKTTTTNKTQKMSHRQTQQTNKQKQQQNKPTTNPNKQETNPEVLRWRKKKSFHVRHLHVPTPNLPCTSSVCIYLPRIHFARALVPTHACHTPCIHPIIPTVCQSVYLPCTYPCLFCTHTVFTPLYPLCSHPTLRASPSGTFLLEERMS